MGYVAHNGHDLNEYEEHDPDECQPCLEANHTVLNLCRCGECCKSFIIEATARDAIREPAIKLLGRKLRDDCTEEYPPDEEAVWVLNGPDGKCVFYEVEQGTCGIHTSRPLVCRLFCCEQYKRD